MTLQVKDASEITQNLATIDYDSEKRPENIIITQVNALNRLGSVWTAMVSADLDIGEETEVTFSTGSKQIEFGFEAMFALSGQYEFLSGGTVGGSPVTIPPINKSFLTAHSGNTQEGVVQAGGTLSDGTNKMVAPVKVGGRFAGGALDDLYLFEANSKYTLKVGSLANSNIVTVVMVWHELD